MQEVDQEDTEDIDIEAQEERVVELAESLAVASKVLEIVVLVAGVLGLLGGIGLVVYTNHDASGDVSHPNLGTGISVIVLSFLGTLVFWAVSRALRVFGEYVSVRLQAASRMAEWQFYSRSARKKECPDCIEDVWEEANVCPHCGYRFADLPRPDVASS